MALELLTTDAQLKTLADIEDAARTGSTTVKVPREALRHLLRDHYTLYGAATGPAMRGGKAHKVTVLNNANG